MNSKNTKTSKELKREVLNELDRVESDINRIQRRLSPGQLIDDVVFYQKGARASFDKLKNNPVGTAFLTVGTLLLMEDENQTSYESSMKGEARETYSKARASVKGAVQSVKSEYAQREDQFSGVSANLQGEYEQTKADFKKRAQEVKTELRNRADDLKSKGNEIKTNLKTLDPLSYVALGAGLGALTGISLPISEKEEEFVDQRLNEKFKEFKQDLQAALNDSANVVKNEFFQDFKDFNINFFGG